jgi:hypothetical protein
VIDLASPGLLRMLQKRIGGPLDRGGAPLRFGRQEGTDFFGRFGWKAAEVRGMLKTAKGLGRLSLWMRILAAMPEPRGRSRSRPRSGVCLLERDRRRFGAKPVEVGVVRSCWVRDYDFLLLERIKGVDFILLRRRKSRS